MTVYHSDITPFGFEASLKAGLEMVSKTIGPYQYL